MENIKILWGNREHIIVSSKFYNSCTSGNKLYIDCKMSSLQIRKKFKLRKDGIYISPLRFVYIFVPALSIPQYILISFY